MRYNAPIRGKITKKEMKPETPNLAGSIFGVVSLANEMQSLKSEVISTVDTKVEEVDSLLQGYSDKADEAIKKAENAVSIANNTLAQAKDEVIAFAKDMHTGPKGEDGISPDKNEIIKQVISQIPVTDEEKIVSRVIKSLPENKANLKILQEVVKANPEEIVNEIGLLSDDKKNGLKLKQSNIVGLEADIASIRNITATSGQMRGGGITQVSHDTTLTGKGTSDDPLKVVGGSGTGDVVGPATNTDGYIPQWNGTNTKTLQNGLPVPTGGLAGLTALGTKQDKLTATSLKTANYTANPNELVICDLSAIGSFSVTLPAAPADGTLIDVQIIKTGTPGTFVEVIASGTDKFNIAGGNNLFYIGLLNDTAQMMYQASTGLWFVALMSQPNNFATNFPGIDAQTPITNTAISIDTTTRILTITPPLGFFNIFIDGNGRVVRYPKTGTISFPAFTDTSGLWYFYFDSTGTPVTTQTELSTSNFPSNVAVYRILWNSTLTGAAKLVEQYIEYHLNTISALDHQQYHLRGAVWGGGTGNFDNKNNVLVSGAPNADGRNAVIALTTGTNIDDNLSYTVTNNTSGSPFTQDMGNIVPATLNATNSGMFKVFSQDVSGNVSFFPATRFPFVWNASTNIPQYVTSVGVATDVPAGNFFVYFVYATQNPVAGDAVKIISAPSNYNTLAQAKAINWIDIQNTYSIIGNDNEIRPLYRVISLYNSVYDVGTKKAVIREVQDLRKSVVTNTSTATGSIPASSVTVVPTGTIASTNAQSAFEELDADKAALTGATFTGAISASNLSGTNTGNETTTTIGSLINGATVATPNDTDFVATAISAGALVNITWTNVKAFLKTYFDTLYVTATGVFTFTNKRTQPRTSSATTTATLTPDKSAYDVYYLTAQSGALTIAAPTGTPVIGETIFGYITDNGTPSTLTFNATYKFFGVAAPATTTASKKLMWSAQYDGTNWMALWANQI